MTLVLSGSDGEAAYNLESATIERFDGGFCVVAKNTGAKQWYPDTQVRYATWELVPAEPTQAAPQ